MMTMMNDSVVVHGWKILAHPLLLVLVQIEALLSKVAAYKAKDPANFLNKSATRRLLAIKKLMLSVVPLNPDAPEYHQGKTLGEEHTAWRRAKFFQQYRLFFRFHSEARIIVFAWVNDEKTKRAYGSASDAYRVFGRMLHSGHPPSDWDALLREAQGACGEFAALLKRLGGGQ
ncbi:MAG: type II toxin-antitoxin system YhaV family toxin [Rhodocyclaceae bacterium]|nr:type II toxin-antitoxin system YhaV family toxin [Rhodocyclaceae bacterium]